MPVVKVHISPITHTDFQDKLTDTLWSFVGDLQVSAPLSQFVTVCSAPAPDGIRAFNFLLRLQQANKRLQQANKRHQSPLGSYLQSTMTETLDLLYSSLEEAINKTKAWTASSLIFSSSNMIWYHNDIISYITLCCKKRISPDWNENTKEPLSRYQIITGPFCH